MKNSFIGGALILMAANAVSKILGAALKIPLTYIMHEEGMAIYNTAFGIYVMFLTFTGAGVPFAVQKLTAAAYAVSDRRQAKTVTRCATMLLCAVGVAGSVMMWCGADFLAAAMREPKAAISIRAIAPAVFLVGAGATVKSGFQGASDMTPTAVSQVVEAVIKLVAGYLFARALISYGTEWAAGGAAAGVAAGEAVATLMLTVWYGAAFSKDKVYKKHARTTIRQIADIALPLLLTSAVCSCLSVVDTSLLRRSLIFSGLSEAEARFAYGAYTGYAATVLNLPAGFLATIGISIVPIISGAAVADDIRRIKRMTRKALIITFICGIGAAAVTAALSETILTILFKNASSAPLLRLAAPSILLVCLMQITGAILQSMGHVGRTFVSSVAVSTVKIAFSVFVASRPEVGIYGAALGTDAAFAVGAVLNLIFLSHALIDKKDALKNSR